MIPSYSNAVPAAKARRRRPIVVYAAVFELFPTSLGMIFRYFNKVNRGQAVTNFSEFQMSHIIKIDLTGIMRSVHGRSR